MHDTWLNVSDKLNAHAEYPDLTKAAFNIDEIDSNYVVKAIAQFERTGFQEILNGISGLEVK